VNYALTYSQLIARAKQRVCINGYVERHHIHYAALRETKKVLGVIASTSSSTFSKETI